MIGLRIAALILLLGLTNSLRSQEYHITRVAANKEVGNGRYNTLFQDKQSVFWFGTTNGLINYDGFKFNQFTYGDSQCSITAIHEDSDGNIWAGTDEGSVLRLAYGELHSIPFKDSGPTSRVIGFYQSAMDSLFSITYSDGLWQIQDTLRPYKSILTNGDIYCHERDSNNNLWLGTDQGIQVCNLVDTSALCFAIGIADGLMDEIVSSLAVDRRNNMWVGTFDNGLGLIKNASARVHEVLPEWENGNITCMRKLDNGVLWVGTESNGLFVVDSFNQIKEIPLPIESSGQIIDIDTDSEGNLWILDARDGLFRTNRHFRVLDTDIGEVQALMENRDNELIVGTDRGLFICDLRSSKPVFKEILNWPANIISLYIDFNNTIWAGTFGDGVIAIPSGQTQPKVFDNKDGISDESVLSIVGKDNKIWLATLGGVTELQYELIDNRLKIISTKNYNEADGLGTDFVYCAAIDHNDNIWFGTDDSGLSVLSNRNLRNFSEINSEVLHAVYSLAVDSDNNVWFTSDDNDLWKYNRSKFELFVDDRLDGEIEISSIITDASDNLLVATDGVISIVNSRDGIVRHYDSESGVQGFSPNLNAISRSANGNIWIGGRSKILQYQIPESDTRNHPITQITGLRLFLGSLETSRSQFKHNENHLTFEFRGIWYSSPTDVGYRYRIDGLEQGWRYTNERSVSYQNIPPGNYTFVVQSSTSPTFSSEEAHYAFEIRAAFYSRPWVISVFVLIIALAVRQIIVSREKRLRSNEELHRKQVESQFQALKAQINPHFLFNILNTLVSAIEEDPDTAVIYVEKLSDFYRSILQYRDQSVISLKDEINLARDYAFLLQMRFDDKLKVDLQINSSKYNIIPLTVQMLIENAVKHNIISSATPLAVKIFVEDEYLIIHNKANRKNSKAVSTQFGLKSIIERYALLTTKPVIIDQSSDYFTVKIPLLE